MVYDGFCHTLRLLLPPATKLGQGYISTGIRHYVNRGVCSQGGVCSGGWGRCVLPGSVCSAGGYLLPRGCLLPGGACSKGVCCQRDVCSQGGVCSPGGFCSPWVCSGGCLLQGEGVCSQGGAWWRPPQDGHCCGCYASYWNAFLYFVLKNFITINH